MWGVTEAVESGQIQFRREFDAYLPSQACETVENLRIFQKISGTSGTWFIERGPHTSQPWPGQLQPHTHASYVVIKRVHRHRRRCREGGPVCAWVGVGATAVNAGEWQAAQVRQQESVAQRNCGLRLDVPVSSHMPMSNRKSRRKKRAIGIAGILLADHAYSKVWKLRRKERSSTV